MRVFITGGTGAVGVAVVEHCVAQGWDVRVISLPAEQTTAGAEHIVCDILDYDAVREQMRGYEAVIHLAAIPNPRVAPAPEIFHVNTVGTYHVFEAAAQEGIRKIVQASSINAFGCFWGNTEVTPRYLPIDEAHPTNTTDVYSFSKEIVEDIGDYYWRREGMSSLALRLPGVWAHERIDSDATRARSQEVRDLIDSYAALPADEQQARLGQIRADCMDFRRKRMLEYPAARANISREDFSDDPLWVQYVFDRFNFWSYVDERDVAQAAVKGLTADFEGSHALFINAANNWLNYDARTLAKLFFPEVTDWRGKGESTQSLVSIDPARALIGYEPEYST